MKPLRSPASTSAPADQRFSGVKIEILYYGRSGDFSKRLGELAISILIRAHRALFYIDCQNFKPLHLRNGSAHFIPGLLVRRTRKERVLEIVVQLVIVPYDTYALDYVPMVAGDKSLETHKCGEIREYERVCGIE